MTTRESGEAFLEQAGGRAAAPAWPFPAARRIGDTVYVGLQIYADAHGGRQGAEIETQTHAVFQSLEDRLRDSGAAMADLTKLHTYYRYDGEGRAVTDYWERMTAARLRHLANPGPAATALRVQGVAPGRASIGIDGIAELAPGKVRIMPRHAWDWSIPTPFSQGWLAAGKVYVGGQISADRQGRSIAPGRVAEQTANTLEYIRHVLLDAKANWDHVVALKIAHKWTADAGASRALAHAILREVEQVFPGDGPALTLLGVDLLYEGLVLEIDATAVHGAKAPVWPADRAGARPHGALPADAPAAGTQALLSRYAAAWRAGAEVHLGAHSAAGHGGAAAQLRASLARLASTLALAGGAAGDLVKVNVFYTAETDASQDEETRGMVAALQGFLAPGRTVVSMVRVAGLLLPDQRVQIDGLAVLGQP
jgi:enamine deaminase RidA (YjgF/YER057c/UK114 family)